MLSYTSCLRTFIQTFKIGLGLFFMLWFSNIPVFFFFFFFIYFICWRLITLQYCSGFCHTLTWISHGFTCIPHPDSPSHLSGSFFFLSAFSCISALLSILGMQHLLNCQGKKVSFLILLFLYPTDTVNNFCLLFAAIFDGTLVCLTPGDLFLTGIQPNSGRTSGFVSHPFISTV